jgi:hypothetical protein
MPYNEKRLLQHVTGDDEGGVRRVGHAAGFKRDLLDRLFGYQVSGVKTLMERVFDNGLENLYDYHRTGGAGEKKGIVTVRGDQIDNAARCFLLRFPRIYQVLLNP